MRRDAGYPETSALFRRHVLGQGSDMIQRNHSKLRGRAERAIGLCAVTPHSPADPFGRYALTDLIDPPGAVAVRNDARIWHAEAERVLTLLDIAGIYAGGRDPNADLARLRVEGRASRQPSTLPAPALASRTTLPSSEKPLFFYTICSSAAKRGNRRR